MAEIIKKFNAEGKISGMSCKCETLADQETFDAEVRKYQLEVVAELKAEDPDKLTERLNVVVLVCQERMFEAQLAGMIGLAPARGVKQAEYDAKREIIFLIEQGATRFAKDLELIKSERDEDLRALYPKDAVLSDIPGKPALVEERPELH